MNCVFKKSAWLNHSMEMENSSPWTEDDMKCLIVLWVDASAQTKLKRMYSNRVMYKEISRCM